MFHLMTHAFFKALLFLGSGSVIHGMHEEQDMRYMGALRKAMPVTAVTFIIGWLSIVQGWNIVSHEVRIEVERGVVKNVQAHVRRNRSGRPEPPA